MWAGSGTACCLQAHRGVGRFLDRRVCRVLDDVSDTQTSWPRPLAACQRCPCQTGLRRPDLPGHASLARRPRFDDLNWARRGGGGFTLRTPSPRITPDARGGSGRTPPHLSDVPTWRRYAFTMILRLSWET